MTATSGPGKSSPGLSDTIKSLRPFVPAKDFQASKSFYRDLGFELLHDSPDLAVLLLGATTFLLQNFYAPGCAENFVVQLVVTDVEAWWRKLQPLDLASRHRVRAPVPPKPMPWNATVLFLFDPSGVMWQITEYTHALAKAE
ncbi:MAG TPA: VOC family protein [Caulobacteraceae bacterium]|jgi:catechol 2,3-dioxygenase-like lactoylglutathione lyase family enzyme